MTVAFLTALGVSRETEERLQEFSALLAKWTTRINLIAPSTKAVIWQRHILDSAQLYPLAPTFSHWADLGSGGGLPGLVIAILAADRAPKAQITLVESDTRKAAFLFTAARALDLSPGIETRRIEHLAPLGADIISARALKPLPELLALVVPHLGPTGRALLPKGRHAEEEIAAANLQWRFDLTRTPSITEPDASILSLERITRA